MFVMSIYVTVAGLVLGSFYNVVGLRVTGGQSIVAPPSRCPSCGQRLRFRDLVPVFSFIILRGRCRSCHQKISMIYPIIEASTGLLFLFNFFHAKSTEEMLTGWLLVSLLMIVLVTDLTKMIIPDKILICFLVFFIIFRFIFQPSPWWDSLLGTAVGFSLLALIAFISRGGMGGGDVKLFAVIGALTGTKMVLFGFFLSTLFGSMIGMCCLLTGLIKRRQPIPFVPFIAMGMLAAFFFGNELFSYYMNFFEALNLNFLSALLP
ncbi:prepilin peptidase [Sporolactobacillus pectinivorans]|uniref:prepilin peptidase n=1 Tax=Sporolactobacillus pectinivorans TaxID=1591408 RepID=UPI001EFE43D9|nr:A24 family peptidase [Sporolactobacillus pectinivorans]